MLNVKNHLDLLGLPVKDRVTGFKGVVASISFDLYGCVQAVVSPGTDKDGKLRDSTWFDVSRLEISKKDPVMPRPDFAFGVESIEGKKAIAEGRKGAAPKPCFSKS